MQAVGASEKVFEFIDRKPKISLDSGILTADRLRGRIEFKNVQFSYPGRPDTVVLKVFYSRDSQCFSISISRN